MTDGQQQAALGLQHLVNILSHGVDLRCQVAQLIAPANRDGLAEITRAKALRACANIVQRFEQAADVRERERGQQQQGGQRDPDEATWAAPPV